MERSKLRPEDSWWTRAAEQFDERTAKEKLDAQIEQQHRAVQLAGRILLLRGLPGYDEFHKALQDIREHALTQLSKTTASNDWMRVLQGQVQAYDNILAVMEKGEARVQALEKALTELQNERALFDRPQKQEAKP